MSQPERVDDPVADLLAWQLANRRREYLATQAPIAPSRPAPRHVDRCHYCPNPGPTRDHIVPRSRLRSKEGFEVGNVVPCCEPCNGAKADARSDCGCSVCVAAWVAYGPTDWHLLPVVEIVKRADA